MLKTSLFEFAHRIAADHFEVVLAPAEEAPCDSPVIVLRDRSQVRERSQPTVHLVMVDRVDRSRP